MTMSDVEESRLLFQFAEGVQFLKLDETPFFTNRFSVLQGSKGVDFIAVQDNALYFIEVKNFSQHEIENKKRLIITSDDNVALEVSYKVRDSIACLVGAFKNDNDILKPFYTKLRSPNVTVRVILFLEGQIENQPAVFRVITDEIKNRLGWLTTKVLVENVSLAKGQLYKVRKLPSSS